MYKVAFNNELELLEILGILKVEIVEDSREGAIFEELIV